MAGVFLRTYLVHSTYVLFCTRATISVFIVKPTDSCRRKGAQKLNLARGFAQEVLQFYVSMVRHCHHGTYIPYDSPVR